MTYPYTIKVPFGVAEVFRKKYAFHPSVKEWCKNNLNGKWIVHRTDDPDQNRMARFDIDRPVTADASFSDMNDAVMFKLFWCEN